MKNFYWLSAIIAIFGVLIYMAGFLKFKNSPPPLLSENKNNFLLENKQSLTNIRRQINYFSQTFKNLGQAGIISVELTANLEELERNGFSQSLTERLEQNVSDLSKLINQLKNKAISIGYPLAESLEDIIRELEKNKQELELLINNQI